MAASDISHRPPSGGALWAILWRAVVVFAFAAPAVVFACFSLWWVSAAFFACYLAVSYAFWRKSPEHEEPPQKEYGGGVLL